MDAATLRDLQAPLKELYRREPTAAATRLHAFGTFSDPGITATIDGFGGRTRAGLHRAAGGDGLDACSGDMLLEAVLACAGVTLRSVATALGVEIRSAELSAESTFDARGTLGLDRSVPVGVGPVTVTFLLETDADDARLTKLAELTERFCVVGQSLAVPPTVEIRRAGDA